MRSSGLLQVPPSAASSCCSDLRDINEAKVNNIMAYLEDVCAPPNASASHMQHHSATHDVAASLESLRSASPAPQGGGLSSSVAMPPRHGGWASTCSGITTLATENHVYNGIKGKIEALRATCDTLQKENALLQAKISDDRRKYDKAASQIRDTARTELDDVLNQLRAANKKHVDVVARLTHERDTAARSLEDALHRLQLDASQREQEKQQLESAHAAAISQLKGRWMVQEKAAREKWKEKELKEMKQSTLKVLQPDIELLLKRHKAEKTRLEEEHKDELRRRDQALADKEAAFEELKARVQQTADSRVALERQLAEDRARDEVNRMRRVMEEERVLAEKKREAQQSIFDERERTLKSELAKVEEEVSALRRQAIEGTMQFRDAVSTEVSKISAGHDGQLQAQRDALDREYTKLKEKVEHDNIALLQSKESQLRSQCKLEMDRHVAAIHQKLESAYLEKVREMKEGDRLVRDKVFRLERQLEQLQTDLELSKGQLKAALETLRQKDEQIAALQRDMRCAREALEAQQDVSEKEFDQRIRFLDGQWQHKLRMLETDKVEALDQLRHEHRLHEQAWAELKSQLESELRTMEQRHNNEITTISERVRVVVATKDGIILEKSERIAQQEVALREMETRLEQHKALLME